MLKQVILEYTYVSILESMNYKRSLHHIFKPIKPKYLHPHTGGCVVRSRRGIVLARKQSTQHTDHLP